MLLVLAATSPNIEQSEKVFSLTLSGFFNKIIINCAVSTLPEEQVSGLEVADVTAVVPRSHVALDVAAAQAVFGNIAAPIPQSL